MIYERYVISICLLYVVGKKIELFLFYLVEKKVVVFFWNGNGMEDKLSM